MFKQKGIEELIKELDPKELAAGLMRAEADDAGENLFLFRKGAKSMLQKFVKDADFVELVMREFDCIYAAEDTDPKVQRIYADHKAAWENWPHGDPIEHWTDESGFFCIRYRSGEWWHYEGLGSDEEITWW